MDFMVSTSSVQEGFCLIHQFHRERKGSNKLENLSHMSGSFKSKVPLGSRKRNQLALVLAASKVESSGHNGRAQKFETSASGHNNSNGNGHFSSVNSSFVLEDVESNNHLRQLVRTGELEEGFKFLENMVYHGNVPDIIPCTTLIRGFCRMGKTRKAAKILEILESSGAVPDVITYNVMISGYCKAEEINNALLVLDRMIVSPDVVTYNIFIKATCKESGVRQPMKLLDEMRDRGCTPNVVTYNVLVNGICNEGRWMDVEKLLADMLQKGFLPDVVTFNILINFLCRKGLLGRAIDILEKMPKHGCQPNVGREKVFWKCLNILERRNFRKKKILFLFRNLSGLLERIITNEGGRRYL